MRRRIIFPSYLRAFSSLLPVIHGCWINERTTRKEFFPACFSLCLDLHIHLNMTKGLEENVHTCGGNKRRGNVTTHNHERTNEMKEKEIKLSTNQHTSILLIMHKKTGACPLMFMSTKKNLQLLPNMRLNPCIGSLLFNPTPPTHPSLPFSYPTNKQEKGMSLRRNGSR